MEIEKKYLIKNIPFELDSFQKYEIIQCYLNLIQEGIERRIRKKNNKFFYTEKSFGDFIREENEKEITEADFTNLKKEQINKSIHKIRFEIPFGKHMIELDIYQDQLEGLKTADVEFLSVEDSKSFIPPDWFDEDITYNQEYKNFRLASLDKFSL